VHRDNDKWLPVYKCLTQTLQYNIYQTSRFSTIMYNDYILFVVLYSKFLCDKGKYHKEGRVRSHNHNRQNSTNLNIISSRTKLTKTLYLAIGLAWFVYGV
jgi:hypothetical protein